MKKALINIILAILFVASFVVLFFIFIDKKHNNVIRKDKMEKIEERIENEKEVVRSNKKAIDIINSRDFNSSYRLDSLKRKHDTLGIIKEQDTLINILRKKEEIFVLNELVYDTIIKNQDSIIEIQKKDVRKLKRQRNIGIAIASVGAVLLILLTK